jgi:hypothetical protein
MATNSDCSPVTGELVEQAGHFNSELADEIGPSSRSFPLLTRREKLSPS